MADPLRSFQSMFQSMIEPGQLRYNSQPHLERSLSSRSLTRPAKESIIGAKMPNPVKPVPVFTPNQPTPSYQQPVSQQVNRIADDDYLFPDLPPPPGINTIKLFFL